MDYNISTKYAAEWLRDQRDDIDDHDLEELLLQAQKQLLALREQGSQGGRTMVATRPHLFKKVKKDIARIKTILREW